MKIKPIPQNKKASHLSIIISMVLFVGFIIFLYIIIKPSLTVGQDKELIANLLEGKLTKEFSSNLTIATFSLDAGYSINLENYDNCFGMTYDTGLTDNIVKDKDENIINSELTGNLLEVEWSDTTNRFFKAYYSDEEFSDNPITGTCDPSPTMEINSVNEDEKIFVTKIQNIINMYDIDYEDLKEYLEVPLNSEFDFNFTYSNGTEIGPKPKKTALDVYVEEIPIDYVDKQANINAGALKIVIW